MWNRLLGCADAIAEWSGKIVSFAILVLIAAILIVVTSRKMGSPLIWPFELALFTYAGYGVLLGAYTMRHNAHVRMDLLYARLSPKAQAIIDLITSPLFFFVFITLLRLGLGEVGHSLHYHERSDSLWAPLLFPIKLTIPVAAFLMLIVGAANFIRNLRYVFRLGNEQEGR